MEILKRYIEEVGQDLVLDDFNVKQQQLRLPSRKHFWVARLIETKVERNNLINKKKDLKKTITKGVIETSPVKISQSSAESAAERHESIQDMTAKIANLNVVIEYLEKVEKIMSQMGYEIKNIVEIQKMEQL